MFGFLKNQADNITPQELKALKAMAKEYFSYNAETYTVSTNGTQADHKVFVLTLANTSQYGNNAFIYNL